MLRSHRICLKATPTQESDFQQHAGYAGLAYEWALGEFKAGLDVGGWLCERSLRPRWHKVKSDIAPWGRDLSQNSAKHAVIGLGQATGAWGEYRRRPPRFKRRRHEQGF